MTITDPEMLNAGDNIAVMIGAALGHIGYTDDGPAGILAARVMLRIIESNPTEAEEIARLDPGAVERWQNRASETDEKATRVWFGTEDIAAMLPKGCTFCATVDDNLLVVEFTASVPRTAAAIVCSECFAKLPT